MAATIDVFWTWCDGSCAGSEKLGVWAFLPAPVKTELRCGASWRKEAGRRGPGGSDWKSWRGRKAPGASAASGTWRGRTPTGSTLASRFWRGRTPPGGGPAGRVGATNVERRFFDAEVGAAGRGGRPSPEMPRGSGAPARRGGGLVRLGPSLSPPEAGSPSPRGADPAMAGILPAAGGDLRRRRAGWRRRRRVGCCGGDSGWSERTRERGKKGWGSHVDGNRGPPIVGALD